MIELTQDPSTIIVWRQHNVLIYYRYEDNASWMILGKCDESKGQCQMLRLELDCPVTPDLKCKCGLLGVWI